MHDTSLFAFVDNDIVTLFMSLTEDLKRGFFKWSKSLAVNLKVKKTIHVHLFLKKQTNYHSIQFGYGGININQFSS